MCTLPKDDTGKPAPFADGTNCDKTARFGAGLISTQLPNATVLQGKTGHDDGHANGMSATRDLPFCGVHSNPDMSFTSGPPTPCPHACRRPPLTGHRTDLSARDASNHSPEPKTTGRARRAESGSSGTKPGTHLETRFGMAPSAPEQRLYVQVSVRQREVHPAAPGGRLLGFLRHAGQRLRVELGVDGPGPTLCSSWTFLEIFIEQHSNRTSTVGRFRDYSAARLPTRSSSPNEPWERAFMCQALRSKAAPWRRFAAARPWSQARSPSL